MKMDTKMAKVLAEKMQRYFKAGIESEEYPALRTDPEFREGFRISNLLIDSINHFENNEQSLFESKKIQIIASFNDNASFHGTGWLELKFIANKWFENLA